MPDLSILIVKADSCLVLESQQLNTGRQSIRDLLLRSNKLIKRMSNREISGTRFSNLEQSWLSTLENFSLVMLPTFQKQVAS